MNIECRVHNEKFIKWNFPAAKYFSGYGKIFFAVSIIFLFISSIKITAQNVDSLINEAILNNPQLKALQYRINSSKYAVASVDNYPAPSLGIEFTQIPVGSANIWDNAVSQNFSISQMFPLGGKISAMTDVKKLNVDVENDNYGDYKIKLISGIKMSYYSLWLIDRKIEVEQENIVLLKNLLKSTETLYSINKVTQADLLMLKGEIASNESQLIVLNNSRDSEIYKLNQLLGRNIESKEVYAAKIIGNRNTIPIDQLEEILIQENPSLKKMKSMVAMNKAETSANEKEMIPDLMLQGMIMRMPQGMILTSKGLSQMMPDETPKTEWMYGLMASITLPFAPWSSGKITARTDELISQTKALESEKEEMTRLMIMQLKQAVSKLKNAAELSELYPGKMIPIYKSTVQAQISAYQNNLTNINSVLESSRMLLMQKMNHFMAQADYQMSLAEIEMMIGKQLNKF